MEKAAAWGIPEEEYPDVPLWSENLPAFNLFVSVANQWRAGGAGPYALDYNVVLRIMDRMELDRDEYDRLFEDIRTMEAAALDAMGN